MGKIGVGVGEDFPVGDPGDPAKASGQAGQAEAAPHETAGNASAQSDTSASDERAEFERWKWRREGERAWAEDVRNQRTGWDTHNRAEWDAWKRTFKDHIRAAVIDGLGRDENWRRSWGATWRPRFWPLGAWGIGIALLVLAIPILVVIAIVALIAAAISAPLTILAAVAGLIVLTIAAFRHRHGHAAGRYRYYTDNDIQSPPRSSRASCPRPRGPIVTPPPQEHS
jgi:hypothetical protein